VAVLDSLLAPYRGLPRACWALALTRGVNTLGFSIVMPLMGLYLVKQRHLPGTTYGWIYLAAGIAAAFSQGIAGELSDRFGRRRIMVLALVLRAGNMVGLGLAVGAQASVHVLGGLVVLNGILRSTFEPAASAALTDHVPDAQRIAAFGLQRTVVNLSWSVGPALGGLLAAQRYDLLFFVSAPVLLLAALVAGRLEDAPRAPVKTERLTPGLIVEIFRENPVFLRGLLLVFAGALLTNQLHSGLTLYLGKALGHPESTLFTVYTINGVLVVLLQGSAVSFIGRYGVAAAVTLGPVLYASAYFFFGLVDSFAWIAVGVAVLTFGEVIFSPALSDLAVYLGDPRRHGRSFGLFGLAQTLGISLGPMLGGGVFDLLGHHHVAMWTVISGLMLLVGLGWHVFARRHAARLRPLR
jgi:MFS family permease